MGKAPLVVAAVTFAGLGWASGDERSFTMAFERAHRLGDLRQLERLVHWEGVDEFTRRSVMKAFQMDFGSRIRSVKIVPVPPGATFEYTLRGTTYRPNLTIVGRLVVDYVPKPEGGVTSSTYLVGRTARGLRIASARPVS